MPRKKKFKALSGMRDIMPDEQPFWKKVEMVCEAMAFFYDFKKITTPIIEEEDLFVKGTGATTDIVEKQMYSFKTKGGEKVVLRPEFTPSLVRVYIEKGLEGQPKPVKVWTLGPLFRYERPQKGRYRQFHQFDFEIFGDKSPASDALMIQLFANLLENLGLKNWEIEVNSIGCKECRSGYKRKLKSFLKANQRKLCADCKKRLQKNPLRVLDCKEEKCQRVKKLAPKITEYLCEECQKHYEKLIGYLKEMNLPFVENPYLVRGLDYYTRTVFEFVPAEKKEKRQTALIGGGRYDYLVEELGGKATPAVGGAGGIERIIEEMKEKKVNLVKIQISEDKFLEKPKVFLLHLGDLAKRKCFSLIEEFKKAKIKVRQNVAKDRLKAQLKWASRLNADYTLILGEKEAKEGTIILRDMKTGIQKIIPLKKVVSEVKKIMKKR